MKLFWRIFLSFWLATILMIAAVLAVGELWPFIFPGERNKFEPEAAQAILAEAVDAYEREGSSGLSTALQQLAVSRPKPLFLFNQDGKILLGDGTPPRYFGDLAREVLHSGRVELQPYFGLRILFVVPVQSKAGHRYAAVFLVFEPKSRIFKMRFWLNLAVALVSSSLICLFLSLYLTRPITRLRTTAQRLAGGDLTARAIAPATYRADELGDLARDFDTMAAQTEVLMTAQRRFVIDVSHELGAPLTRLHLALALLRRQLAADSPRELQRIERETAKLSNLVQQLLLLAGLEAGRCPAEDLAPVSIASLCESISEDASFEAEHANCRIAGSREDITLQAYPQLLRRAIDNVLRNAIRYAPLGSEILLNSTVAEDSQKVVIEILDGGPGVPQSMLGDIFRPFFRAPCAREDNGANNGGGGTGLGLAIAAEAVRLHNGTITARNRLTSGLHVTITLPSVKGTLVNDLAPAEPRDLRPLSRLS